MVSLAEKMLKAGKAKGSALMSKSKFFNDRDFIPTDLPILNIAFSGRVDGGLATGLTVLAGESKTFKTLAGLYCMKAYFDRYPDAIALFYDCEYGVTEEYLKMYGIDSERVIHIPIEDIEDLKFDISQRLEAIDRGDKVFIFLDSLGNLASKKEAEDALDGKSVADMSRAKAIKSLFRIVTPKIATKDIPCVVINHTYASMCLAGDTTIKTLDGYSNISDIKLGDIVYTNNGTQRVTNVFGPDMLDSTGKEFLELTFDDGSTVKCTHDHKFLMKDSEWCSAIDMKIGDQFM